MVWKVHRRLPVFKSQRTTDCAWLVARVQAILRRTTGLGGPPVADDPVRYTTATTAAVKHFFKRDMRNTL